MEILQERIKELEETMESDEVETAVSAIEQNPKPPAITMFPGREKDNKLLFYTRIEVLG